MECKTIYFCSFVMFRGLIPTLILKSVLEYKPGFALGHEFHSISLEENYAPLLNHCQV